MERRQMLSFVLPLAGLLITVPELMRLMDATRAAEACLERAKTEVIECQAAPDSLVVVVAAIFGLVFTARLVAVTLEYWRAART